MLKVFRQIQRLRRQLSEAKERRVELGRRISEAYDMLFAVVDQHNTKAKKDGEELEQTYKSLQIFTKLLDLLAQNTTQFSKELEAVQSRLQDRRTNLQHLHHCTQLFKTTQCFDYPGSAAGAFSIDSLSNVVGAHL